MKIIELNNICKELLNSSDNVIEILEDFNNNRVYIYDNVLKFFNYLNIERTYKKYLESNLQNIYKQNDDSEAYKEYLNSFKQYKKQIDLFFKEYDSKIDDFCENINTYYSYICDNLDGLNNLVPISNELKSSILLYISKELFKDSLNPIPEENSYVYNIDDLILKLKESNDFNIINYINLTDVKVMDINKKQIESEDIKYVIDEDASEENIIVKKDYDEDLIQKINNL